MATVLIAGGEREYCKKVKARLLKSGDFEVKTVSNGEEALSCISDNYPDVLVLSSFMQKKDAIEVLSELKKSELTETKSIFILTPKLSDEIFFCFQKYNVRHIFTLPIEASIIEKHIRKAVGLKGDIQEFNVDKRVEDIIAFYLKKCGISPKLKGYAHLKKLVEYSIKHGKTKTYTELLSQIACESGTEAWKSIDRNIRTAIESAWIKGSIEEQHSLFGYSVSPLKGRPTNKEFSAMITQKVKESLAHS